MIISNSAGPINQALDRGRSFARVFGGEIKWVQRVRSTGLVLSRSAIGLENDVRWRDLWSADEPGLSFLRWSIQHLWDLYI